MMRLRRKPIELQLVVFVASVVGLFLPWARAQESIPDEGSPTVLTPSQLAEFAAAVGAPVGTVAERVLLDPVMLQLALEANEARSRRLRQGRMLRTIGIVSLAAGVGLGVLGAVAWSRYHPSCTVERDGGGCSDFNVGPGLVVMGVAVAAGGAVVGVLGLRKLELLSDAEEAAVNRYWPEDTSHPRRPPSTRPEREDLFSSHHLTSKGPTFVLSLLSVSF